MRAPRERCRSKFRTPSCFPAALRSGRFTTVVAADHATGNAVLLSSGDLRMSVMASTAIRGVLPPIERGAQTLLDGAFVAHVPIVPAKDTGCRTRTMVVFDAGFP